MRTWYRVPVERYEKGGEGGGSRRRCLFLVVERMPRMGKDRNMAGFNKGHSASSPSSGTAVLRETLVACLIKRRCAA